MFAFLNNAHEANVHVYTPEEQMRRATSSAGFARSRPRCESGLRIGENGWRNGKRKSPKTSLNGPS